MVLEVTRMLREDYLQQFAFHEIDSHCPLEKQYFMLKAILTFYKLAMDCIHRGVTLTQILNQPFKEEIARMKEIPGAEAEEKISDLINRMRESFAALEVV
jgi:V/A-type H+-transporting ATPase subunit A